jgi:hypothetical protein
MRCAGSIHGLSNKEGNGWLSAFLPKQESDSGFQSEGDDAIPKEKTPFRKKERRHLSIRASYNGSWRIILGDNR